MAWIKTTDLKKLPPFNVQYSHPVLVRILETGCGYIGRKPVIRIAQREKNQGDNWKWNEIYSYGYREVEPKFVTHWCPIPVGRFKKGT